MPVRPSIYVQPTGLFEKYYRTFLDYSRTHEVLTLLEKRSSLQVDRDADDLLPSIDLVAGYRVQGAEYAVSKINLRKRYLTTLNVTHRLRADLKSLYAQLKRESELFEIAREKIDLAERVLKAETENYSYGKVTLNDYIQSVNVLDNNRFNRSSRDARLKRLVVEWLRLSDKLVGEIY